MGCGMRSTRAEGVSDSRVPVMVEARVWSARGRCQLREEGVQPVMRKFVLALGGLGLAIAAAACGGSSSSSSSSSSGAAGQATAPATTGAATAVKKGGILKGAISKDYDYWDGTGYYGDLWSLEYVTGNALLDYPDQPGPNQDELIPGVAADLPQVSADGLTYTFKIRQGLKFNNGAPVTPEEHQGDVRALARPGRPVRRADLDAVLLEHRRVRQVHRGRLGRQAAPVEPEDAVGHRGAGSGHGRLPPLEARPELPVRDLDAVHEHRPRRTRRTSTRSCRRR